VHALDLKSQSGIKAILWKYIGDNFLFILIYSPLFQRIFVKNRRQLWHETQTGLKVQEMVQCKHLGYENLDVVGYWNRGYKFLI